MSRSRALDLEAPRPRARTCTNEMADLAQGFYEANKRKNAASVDERKQKGALHKLMIREGVSEFAFDGVFEGTTTPMVAAIKEDTVEQADVAKLRGLVDDETFMKIISATKKAITDIAGDHVYQRCAVDITKPPALKVQKASS